MTAQIAVLNKNGVALASDSALTVPNKKGDDKIFNSDNKLFNLSKYYPVGIMVNGFGDFMGVPWETLVKMYREKLGKTKFDKLEYYAKDFIKFLKDFEFPEQHSAEKSFIEYTISQIFQEIHDEIYGKIIEASRRGDDAENVAVDTINAHYRKWEKAKIAKAIPKKYPKNLMKKYGKIVHEKIIFSRDPKKDKRVLYFRLKMIAANSLSKFLFEDELSSGFSYGDELSSGVVIAGFGEKDIFPSVITYELKGIIDGTFIHAERSIEEIGLVSGSVKLVPFAQSEEVYAFMFGHNKLVNIVQDSMEDIFDKGDPGKKADTDKLVDLSERVINYRKEQSANIVSGIELLGKTELAEVAEAFIKLTVLRKRVTPVLETVGGPVDVAVISKGDGFVWVKRKRYVDPSLNPQFSEILTK